MIITTVNVALWAFRPNDFGNGPQLHQGIRRWPGAITVAWVIYLPLASAVSWGFGADGPAAGYPGAWWVTRCLRRGTKGT